MEDSPWPGVRPVGHRRPPATVSTRPAGEVRRRRPSGHWVARCGRGDGAVRGVRTRRRNAPARRVRRLSSQGRLVGLAWAGRSAASTTGRKHCDGRIPRFRDRPVCSRQYVVLPWYQAEQASANARSAQCTCLQRYGNQHSSSLVVVTCTRLLPFDTGARPVRPGSSGFVFLSARCNIVCLAIYRAAPSRGASNFLHGLSKCSGTRWSQRCRAAPASQWSRMSQ